MEFIKKCINHPAAQYLLRLYQNIEDDYIGLLAAGVAFYCFMAAFPALAAMISLYGLFSDPNFITQQLSNLENFLPPESLKILSDQARSIAATSQTALGLGFIVGILLALYTTTKGIHALIKGLNIAYNVRETRNIVVLNSTAFLLTFGMMLYLLFSLSLIAFLPAFFNIIHLPDYITAPLLTLRWPLLMLSAMLGIQIVYYIAPAHKQPQWRWMSWGAVIATLFWLGGSSLFSLFVSNFGRYNETYGSLGAVAVLLLWFWLNALTILFGAEVNASFRQRDNSRKTLDDPQR
ncbi:MAG: YihY/virulence factor BrkB family protein [Micavibrio sp.]